MRARFWRFLAVSPCLSMAGFAGSDVPFFSGMGFVPGGGFEFSIANGVSGDGSVVTGTGTRSNNSDAAFRWTQATGMVDLGGLPGGPPSSLGFAVSTDGQTVVGRGYQGGTGDYEAFRWRAGTGMIALGDLAGGGFRSESHATSADGSVVVGQGISAASGSGYEAFRWTANQGMVGLGDMPGGNFFSIANGVSADGSAIVGVSNSAPGGQAFRWTESTGMVGLGDLPGGGFYSNAVDISQDGSTVVGESHAAIADRLHAFRWTQATGMTDLGVLAGFPPYSQATGVSGDGSVVVGWVGDYTTQQAAFIWDSAHGIRNLRTVMQEFGLDLTGWTQLRAFDVSADGQTIVGNGMNASGRFEAWIAHIPEPASMWLMALGAAVVARRR